MNETHYVSFSKQAKKFKQIAQSCRSKIAEGEFPPMDSRSFLNNFFLGQFNSTDQPSYEEFQENIGDLRQIFPGVSITHCKFNTLDPQPGMCLIMLVEVNPQIPYTDPARRIAEKVNFGKFSCKIVFDFYEMSLVASVYDYLDLSSNSLYQECQVLHPHIAENNNICLGSWKYQKDFCSLNLIGILHSFCQLLYTYNPASVYSRPIEAWIRPKCLSCGQYTECTNCIRTGESVCEKCVVKDESGNCYSPSCVETCSKCSKESPSTYVKNKEVFCEQCIKAEM